MTTKNYYLVLGISPTESSSGIRDAFRELAKRYHPDRVGPTGTPVFQDIVEAYQVLSDPERRKQYNQGLRHAEASEAMQSESIIVRQGPRAEPLVPEPMSIFRDFQTFGPSFEALFERFQRNFSHRGTPKGERLAGLNLEVILSPDEALRGGATFLGVPVFHLCPVCSGSGRDWLFACTYCHGQGMIEEEETVRIDIPPMVRDGTVLEVPIHGLGIDNLYLRLYVRLSSD
jgi:DnaJ-class molecular chaperone